MTRIQQSSKEYKWFLLLRDSLAGGTEAPVRWADPQAGPDVDQGFTFATEPSRWPWWHSSAFG